MPLGACNLFFSAVVASFNSTTSCSKRSVGWPDDCCPFPCSGGFRDGNSPVLEAESLETSLPGEMPPSISNPLDSILDRRPIVSHDDILRAIDVPSVISFVVALDESISMSHEDNRVDGLLGM
jgi:hypothetical protein